MLTGKAKDLFVKYYSDRIYEEREDYKKYPLSTLLRKFERKTFVEKYGWYVDFFDSVGIYIESSGICLDGIHSYFYNIQENDTLNGVLDEDFTTRHQAREEAIKKANLIYNEKY